MGQIPGTRPRIRQHHQLLLTVVTTSFFPHHYQSHGRIVDINLTLTKKDLS